MNKYFERIERLRSLMRAKDWDAVVIYGTDPHFSEYPALRWKQIEWLTGFTGEAADVVVTLDDAGLWTDSRYFIQAEAQLAGTGVSLYKTRIPGAVSIEDWLLEEMGWENVNVAIDSFCTSVSSQCALMANFNVVGIPDLLSPLWEDRPGIVQTPIFCVNPGESMEEKVAWLREEMTKEGVKYVLISSLDEIAWLLNVRAGDIDYTPVVISYLLVGLEDIKWFVIRDTIEDEGTSQALAYLSERGVQCLSYDEVTIELRSLEGVWVDRDTLNVELDSSLVEPHYASLPIQQRKAVKNPVEIDNMRRCHLRDGVAMEKFFYWLEKSLENGTRISEWDASVRLGEYRREIEDYVEDSFETISAFGKGAALPHYHTPNVNAPLLEPYGLYLNDSGGQFLSGTTDITRTIPLGECSPMQRREYTLVLKSHIDLATSLFPSGTPGCRVDAAARMPLWREKLDFGHGTGHGVGYFLGVHEGPAQIRQNMSSAGLFEGMITSIEPGIYREGLYGIRHENLYLIADAGENEFGHFLKFEPLTLCHFDTSILDLSLLDEWEIEWLNNYNQRVYESVGPFLEENIREWLKEKTSEIRK